MKAYYDHRLRKHVAALSANLYINVKRRANVLNNIAEIVNSLPKEKAIYKIQLMNLKALRRAYLLRINPTG